MASPETCTNCGERPRQQGPGTLCAGCVVMSPREVVPVEEFDRVERERDALADFVYATWWMARRYADGRKTYAPEQFNSAMRQLLESGFEVASGDRRRYAHEPQEAGE